MRLDFTPRPRFSISLCSPRLPPPLLRRPSNASAAAARAEVSHLRLVRSEVPAGAPRRLEAGRAGACVIHARRSWAPEVMEVGRVQGPVRSRARQGVSARLGGVRLRGVGGRARACGGRRSRAGGRWRRRGPGLWRYRTLGLARRLAGPAGVPGPGSVSPSPPDPQLERGGRSGRGVRGGGKPQVGLSPDRGLVPRSAVS